MIYAKIKKTIDKKMLQHRKKGVIWHVYLHIAANSLQRPLSSVSKVTIVERFYCSCCTP